MDLSQTFRDYSTIWIHEGELFLNESLWGQLSWLIVLREITLIWIFRGELWADESFWAQLFSDESFSVLVYSHNESFTSESFSDVLYHSKGNHSPMTHLPERTADAVGCAGPADSSGGWACRWSGLEEWWNCCGRSWLVTWTQGRGREQRYSWPAALGKRGPSSAGPNIYTTRARTHTHTRSSFKSNIIFQSNTYEQIVLHQHTHTHSLGLLDGGAAVWCRCSTAVWNQILHWLV